MRLEGKELYCKNCEEDIVKGQTVIFLNYPYGCLCLNCYGNAFRIN